MSIACYHFVFKIAKEWHFRPARFKTLVICYIKCSGFLHESSPPVSVSIIAFMIFSIISQIKQSYRFFLSQGSTSQNQCFFIFGKWSNLTKPLKIKSSTLGNDFTGCYHSSWSNYQKKNKSNYLVHSGKNTAVHIFSLNHVLKRLSGSSYKYAPFRMISDAIFCSVVLSESNASRHLVKLFQVCSISIGLQKKRYLCSKENELFSQSQIKSVYL